MSLREVRLRIVTESVSPRRVPPLTSSVQHRAFAREIKPVGWRFGQGATKIGSVTPNALLPGCTGSSGLLPYAAITTKPPVARVWTGIGSGLFHRTTGFE